MIFFDIMLFNFFINFFLVRNMLKQNFNSLLLRNYNILTIISPFHFNIFHNTLFLNKVDIN